MKSIAFVVPYFGHFNNYFHLWLKSCAKNPTVDWYLFSDDRRVQDYPANVHLVETSFDAFRKRIQAVFDFPIRLERPYKLCDFKPAYGLVFGDVLKGYDFWGHCDTDLIFGNIRSILTDDVLETHEKISRWGHCSLYANNDKMNHLFRREYRMLPSYREVFGSPKSYLFDERIVHGLAKEAGVKTKNMEDAYFDCNIRYRRFRPAPCQSKVFNPGECHIMEWNDGELSLLSTDRESVARCPIMYAHFQKRAMRVTENLGERFFVYDSCFGKIDRDISADLIRTLSPDSMIHLPYAKFILKKIVKKLCGKGQFYHYSKALAELTK